jgi:TRAP-type C4-dicarboxylate transport system permease small subunit
LVRRLSLSLAYCSAVAGIILISLAAAATVANVVQLSTVGFVTIGGPGGIPEGSFVDVALGVSAWLMLLGLPLGIVLLGVAVLEASVRVVRRSLVPVEAS